MLIGFLILLLYVAMICGILLCIYKNAAFVVFPFIAFAWGWDQKFITGFGILDGMIFAAIVLGLCIGFSAVQQLGLPFYLLCYTLILWGGVILALNTLCQVIIGMIIVVAGGAFTAIAKENMEYFAGPFAIRILFRLLGGIMYFFTVLYNESYIMHAIHPDSEGWWELLNNADFPKAFQLGLPHVFWTFFITAILILLGIIRDILDVWGNRTEQILG